MGEEITFAQYQSFPFKNYHDFRSIPSKTTESETFEALSNMKNYPREAVNGILLRKRKVVNYKDTKPRKSKVEIK